MEINNSIILSDAEEILIELRRQLALNGIQRFNKIIKTSNNIQTNCPFHKDGQEKKPSFGILIRDQGNYKAGTCHCLACGWSGSFTEVISNCFGYDDMGAFGQKWLVSNFLSIGVEERSDLELDMSRDLSNDIKKAEYVSPDVLDSYRYIHPYLAKRRIVNEDIIELFDLGYDKETDCITFPIRDINGNCLFVARRSVRTKYFNYPAGVEKPLYGLYEYLTDVQKSMGKLRTQRSGKSYFLEKANEVIVCESMIDALTCWQYGKYAVALNGLGNDLQFKQLRELPCRKLILATDNDERGMKARERIAKNVPNKIITQYIIPEIKREDGKITKDINDLEYDEFKNLKEIFI